MHFENLRRTLNSHLKNLPGWHSNRRIVVIESDDWGSIRMPSRKAYRRLLNAGLNLNGGDGQRYSLYDSLETSKDLELLYEILYSAKDCNNVSAVVTANIVVANPDFDKIEGSDFQHYFYEPVSETFKKYSGGEETIKFWKEGISKNLFVPQFHGREHLNVLSWMNALKANDRETHLAFKEGMWSFIPKYYNGTNLEYEAAFQLSELSELTDQGHIINDGLWLFESLLGYKAEYFVPPNGTINNRLNATCYKSGIRYRSASPIQEESIGKNKNRKVVHWLGQKEQNGLRYIVRNCVFEPSKKGEDWVDRCLNDIRLAFRYKRPAIITTHRVNFIGVHDKSNRDYCLKNLHKLLQSIISRWPEVEFMTTKQLGDLIAYKSKNLECVE